MGLYDGYQLANSRSIPEYRGSIVPEMVQVSQELQNRYNTSQNNMDYANQFLNSLSALPQDQTALAEVRKKYQDKLSAISGRKDLENATRETTMLAQQLPQDYAGFAQRQKDFTERKAEYDKKVSEGKLTPEEAQALLQRDIHLDKGIQKDPATGRYTGRFQGQEFTDTYDMRKGVDEIMDKQFPVTAGWTKEVVGSGDNEKWIFKNGSKTVTLDAHRIKNIVGTGLQNDPHAQAWINQQKSLGTYHLDYSKVRPEEIANLPADIQNRLAKGESLTSIIKNAKAADIHNDILNKAYSYAVNKYKRNDRELTSEIKANEYKLKEKDDETPAFTAYINQPLDGYQFTDIKDVHSAKDVSSNMKVQANTDYNNFIKSGVTQTGPQTNPDTKWYKTGPDGKKIDVTDEAKRLLYAYNQASQQEKQWNERISDVYNTAGIKQGSALVKDAEGIKGKVLNILNTAKFDGENIAGILNRVGDADVKKYLTQAYNRWQTEAFAGKDGSSGTPAQILANYAYNARIANSPEYGKVNQILKEDNKNGMQMVGVTPFRSKSTNEALGHLFSNLTSNLDNGSLKQGILGLEWASGDKSGQSLEADDYSKLKGKSEFAGAGLVNGKLYMYFNVDNTTHSSGEIKGDKMLVRTPAFNGVVETMIKHKMVDQAQLMISDGVSNSLKNPNKSGEAVPGTGIKVEGIPNTVRENSAGAMQNSNLKVIVPLNNGGQKVYNVNSTGEATNLIYNILKAH